MNPPQSRKAEKYLQSQSASLEERLRQIRADMEEATNAWLRCLHDLEWAPIDRSSVSVGFAELVVHFKGDILSATFIRHGFQVEGQSGFYKATYVGVKNGKSGATD